MTGVPLSMHRQYMLLSFVGHIMGCCLQTMTDQLLNITAKYNTTRHKCADFTKQKQSNDLPYAYFIK